MCLSESTIQRSLRVCSRFFCVRALSLVAFGGCPQCGADVTTNILLREAGMAVCSGNEWYSNSVDATNIVDADVEVSIMLQILTNHASYSPDQLDAAGRLLSEVSSVHHGGQVFLERAELGFPSWLLALVFSAPLTRFPRIVWNESRSLPTPLS